MLRYEKIKVINKLFEFDGVCYILMCSNNFAVKKTLNCNLNLWLDWEQCSISCFLVTDV